MKVGELGRRLKALTGEESYAGALAAVEQALNPQETAPVGVVLLVNPAFNGQYWATVIGANLSVEQMRALRQACLAFAGAVDRDVQTVMERRVQILQERLEKEEKS